MHLRKDQHFPFLMMENFRTKQYDNSSPEQDNRVKWWTQCMRFQPIWELRMAYVERPFLWPKPSYLGSKGTILTLYQQLHGVLLCLYVLGLPECVVVFRLVSSKSNYLFELFTYVAMSFMIILSTTWKKQYLTYSDFYRIQL